MAFVVKDYGNGSLGDVDSVSSTINSYARVTAVTSSTITINTSTQISGTATFTVGAKILLHVSATTSSSYKTYLGCYLLANVTAVSSNVLTLDADPTKCIPSAQLANYYVQAIAVAQYKNLTLNSGTTITPPIYNATNFVGGIVALMCSEALTFGGGHINLTDKGIPPANKALRPTTNNDPVDDIDTYSGWENSDTHIHFMLNSGDGAAFIVAKSMTCHTSSRIGNTATYGVQFYRGATNSVTYNETKPSNVTNVGGSTILIAAQTIENFMPKMIAKYRSSTATAGQGICRCYIASETKLRNDEGLYAYDCISDKVRVKQKFGIKNFGNGSNGNLTIFENTNDVIFNNHAPVVSINKNKVTIGTPTTDGLAPISTGAMVMVHWNHRNKGYLEDSGKFIVANVLDYTNGVLTLDATPPAISITNYYCQVVSIPQYNNLTISADVKISYSLTGTNSAGLRKIVAVAVKDTFNLSGGKLSPTTSNPCTASTAYEREGLGIIGNAQDCDKLPIGAGFASMFILAQNLIVNADTCIGFYYQHSSKLSYRGISESLDGTGWERVKGTSVTTKGGSGAYGGYLNSITEPFGGYGSNALRGRTVHWCPQGAHIMIVANKITNIAIKNICSGGYGSEAGYGGRAGMSSGTYRHYGGYNGGGGSESTDHWSGGSSGWAFIYCNKVVSQNTTGTILAN